MQVKLYASNYQQRREETFTRSGGQCENILATGERCSVKWGDWRITRSHQLQFEQLLIHHPHGDPENPDAVLVAVYWACHMRLHRKPSPGRTKASARKQGYEVIRIPYLMEVLARVGFSTWTTANGRVGWHMGTLASEANDPIGALAMALHWLSAEVRDLAQARAEHLRLTDLIIRTQQAEERRQQDTAIRETVCR